MDIGSVLESMKSQALKILCVAAVLGFGLSRVEASSTTTWMGPGVEITVFNAPYGINWDSGTVVPSTATCPAVAVSSCAIMQGDATDCYLNCVNPNGTPTQSTGTWVQCP
jgi:hypothetical protein